MPRVSKLQDGYQRPAQASDIPLVHLQEPEQDLRGAEERLVHTDPSGHQQDSNPALGSVVSPGYALSKAVAEILKGITNITAHSDPVADDGSEDGIQPRGQPQVNSGQFRNARVSLHVDESGSTEHHRGGDPGGPGHASNNPPSCPYCGRQGRHAATCDRSTKVDNDGAGPGGAEGSMTGAMVSTPTAGRTGRRTKTQGTAAMVSKAVAEVLASLLDNAETKEEARLRVAEWPSRSASQRSPRSLRPRRSPRRTWLPPPRSA